MLEAIARIAALLTITLVAVIPALAQEDLNCENFASQAKSQAALDADPSDPNGLDEDGDGLACEGVPHSLAEPDAAGPLETPGPGTIVSSVTPPPGADSPVFVPAEPDVAGETPPTQQEDPKPSPSIGT